MNQPTTTHDVTDEKIVEIGPDLTDAPMKGIDPDAKEPA